MDEKDDNVVEKKIIKEKKISLQYAEERYDILIQLNEVLIENFISIIVKKDVKTVDYIYETQMKYEDFKKLGSKLLRLYDSIQEIFNFIVDSFDKDRINIKEITYSILTLTISIQETFGFEENLSLELKLKRKSFEIDDTIKDLYERINKLENENKKIIQLENENKKLVEKINEMEKFASKLIITPEFSLDKFSIIVYSRYNINGQYKNYIFRTPTTNNWAYTSTQKCLSSSPNNNNYSLPLFAIISEHMENNIIIFCGNIAPPKSYYVQLIDDTRKHGNYLEGLFYDNNFICPIRYSQYTDLAKQNFNNKIICLYGKIKK